MDSFLSFLTTRISRSPVRCDLQLFERLRRIIGGYWDFKQVLAIHALVHHKVDVNRCGLTRLQCRLTDDGVGRSTSLQQGHGSRHIQVEGTVSHVLEIEQRAHGVA